MKYNVLFTRRAALTCAVLFVVLIIAAFRLQTKPVIYLIGDSTVATGSSSAPSQGWGAFLGEFFDLKKVEIQNRAVAGISSRTYYTGVTHNPNMKRNGMWDSIRKTLQPGDYVLIQFGHNDDSPVVDTSRNRGSLKGISADTLVVFNPYSKKQEVVHTYGWYIAQFIKEAKERGAIPVVCSPIPKNNWAGDSIKTSNNPYINWAAEAAAANGAFFINLNKRVAEKYKVEGQQAVAGKFFVADNVHTTPVGARLNAGSVVEGLKALPGCTLTKYLTK